MREASCVSLDLRQERSGSVSLRLVLNCRVVVTATASIPNDPHSCQINSEKEAAEAAKDERRVEPKEGKEVQEAEEVEEVER